MCVSHDTLSRVLLLVRSGDVLALRAVVQAPDEVSVSCAGLSLYLLRPSPLSFNKYNNHNETTQYHNQTTTITQLHHDTTNNDETTNQQSTTINNTNNTTTTTKQTTMKQQFFFGFLFPFLLKISRVTKSFFLVYYGNLAFHEK